MMKKVISMVLALVMLASLTMVSATADVAVFDPHIAHSITEPDSPMGNSLGFFLRMNVQGVAVNEWNEIRTANATVQHEGETLPLLSIGAVVSNNAAVGADATQMVRENAAAGTQTVDVAGHFLYEVTEEYCAYAVRIINIPDSKTKTNIYVRPYYVVQLSSGPMTVYGDITSRQYYESWCATNTTLPEAGSDADMKKTGRILVSTAERNGDTVSLTLYNSTKNWITEETDYIKVTCYDETGTALGDPHTIYIGVIDTKKHKNKTFTFDVPPTTTEVLITASKITFWTEWS